MTKSKLLLHDIDDNDYIKNTTSSFVKDSVVILLEFFKIACSSRSLYLQQELTTAVSSGPLIVSVKPWASIDWTFCSGTLTYTNPNHLICLLVIKSKSLKLPV